MEAHVRIVKCYSYNPFLPWTLPGEVLKQWDECNAYRLQLDDGTEVHAPMDDDSFVMKA